LGKLIPAGTGLTRYRNVRVEPTEEAKAQMYPAGMYGSVDFDYFGGSESVPLEEYDVGEFQ
ncbi:MAG TPA: hypothetical protein VK096_03150, partial [Actinomycetales bacterium]|nr:hypothetical protein [Actinomycetales bacterium]